METSCTMKATESNDEIEQISRESGREFCAAWYTTFHLFACLASFGKITFHPSNFNVLQRTILSQHAIIPSKTHNRLQQLQSTDSLLHDDKKSADPQANRTRSSAPRISSTNAALKSAGHREALRVVTTITSQIISSTLKASPRCLHQDFWCTCHASFAVLSTTDAESVTRCSNREVNTSLLHHITHIPLNKVWLTTTCISSVSLLHRRHVPPLLCESSRSSTSRHRVVLLRLPTEILNDEK
jgi:hypothetical protein